MTNPCTLSEAAKLQRVILNSPALEPIIRCWSAISLPDCWLVAGAIARTAWNDAFAFEPGYGLSDIDLVYFDASDLSEESEARHADRVRRAFSDLGVKLDVKNEARVHLWYSQRFSYEIGPYRSMPHAIRTFPTTATAIGIQPSGSQLLISAPFGLSDLLGTIVRPNKAQITREIYEAKVARWRAVWPKLTILGWTSATPNRITPP